MHDSGGILIKLITMHYLIAVKCTVHDIMNYTKYIPDEKIRSNTKGKDNTKPQDSRPLGKGFKLPSDSTVKPELILDIAPLSVCSLIHRLISIICALLTYLHVSLVVIILHSSRPLEDFL